MSRHGDHLRRSSLFKPGDTIGNDRSEAMNRVERAIVRGIRDEFGPGMQHQVGDASGFEIAVAGTDVVIRVGRLPDEQALSTANAVMAGLLPEDALERLPTGDYDDVQEEA